MNMTGIVVVFFFYILVFIVGYKLGINMIKREWKKDIENCIKYYENLRLKFDYVKIGEKHFLSLDGKIWYLVEEIKGGYRIISEVKEEKQRKAILKQIDNRDCYRNLPAYCRFIL